MLVSEDLEDLPTRESVRRELVLVLVVDLKVEDPRP
jgi:hypothetical protein